MMKFLLVFLLGFVGSSASNEVVQSFIKQLPQEEVSTLDWFFRNCIKSFGGYVLYGDKPVCIEYLHSKRADLLCLNEYSCAKIKAFEILKSWKCEEGDYLFLFCDCCECTHMIIINRKAFIRTVNENIALFRYVLGRTLTAENLLLELVKNQNHFYEVLKEDTALLGILLGYGTNNSLIVSRAEAIAAKENDAPNREAFPFNNLSCQEKPSLGFSSVDDEIRTLHKMFVYSRNILNFNSFDIPAFGCEPASNETDSLLATYEKNRGDLLAIAERDDFLEKTLERIFTNNPGKLKIPSAVIAPSFFPVSGALASQFVEIVHHLTDVEGLDQEALLQSFLRGVVDREQKEIEPFSDPKDAWLSSDLRLVPQQLECCKNLIAANKCFHAISLKKEWVSLIPNGIAYRVLREGGGQPASSKIKNATFHVACRLAKEKKLQQLKTICKGNIECLIPGIAHSLIDMKKGEERMLCIHPRYSYGVSMSPDPPNETLFVHIQLMDFEVGEADAVILPPCDLEPVLSRSEGLDEPIAVPMLGLDSSSYKDLAAIYRELLVKNQKLNERKFYNYGILFWSSIKQNDIEIDFDVFCDKLKLPVQSDYFEGAAQRDKFILDFKSYLFQLQYEKGESPPFLRYFLS
jgi:FKBP-type peptidyl-prolyl cis-trans isomerase